ncbi:MAG: hypothetical protein ABR550_13015, partial [Wenzhouxiangellaceae bacterium]
ADSASEGIYPNPDVFMVDVGGDDFSDDYGDNRGSNPVNLTLGNAAAEGGPLFSPDGQLLAFSRQHIPGFYGDQRKLIQHELATGRTRLVHGDWDRLADGLVWSPDSAGLFGAIDDAGTLTYAVPVPLAVRCACPIGCAYSSEYTEDDWVYLRSGVLIRSFEGGLFHII